MRKFNTLKRLKYKSINKQSQFALIGNNIDGFINVGVIIFSNFYELKLNLPTIFKSLEYGGEWDLKLYELNGNLKIKKLYGYYKTPIKGKEIFKYSYMDSGENIEMIITDALIHICSSTEECIVNEEDTNLSSKNIEQEIYQDIITVLLKERNTRCFEREEYYI